MALCGCDERDALRHGFRRPPRERPHHPGVHVAEKCRDPDLRSRQGRLRAPPHRSRQPAAGHARLPFHHRHHGLASAPRLRGRPRLGRPRVPVDPKRLGLPPPPISRRPSISTKATFGTAPAAANWWSSPIPLSRGTAGSSRASPSTSHGGNFSACSTGPSRRWTW